MDSLKILSASIKNFKNISQRKIDIDGRSLVVIGPNAEGKSSFIQGLLSPLDRKYIPSKPIKEGEKRGSVSITLGGDMNGAPTKYDIDIYFTPANLKGRLVVTNEDGETITPAKTVVKSLIGDIGFDIFSFLKSRPKEQVEALKKIAGINFMEIDKEYKKIYEDRTYMNKKVAETEALLSNNVFSPDDCEAYRDAKDEAPIIEKINSISKKMEDHMRIENGIQAKGAEVLKNEERIKEIQRQVIALEEEAEGLTGKNVEIKKDIKKGEAWLKSNSKPNASKYNKELQEIRKHNAKVAEVSEYKKKNTELNQMKLKSEWYTQELTRLNKDKEKMISESKLPVKGLTFTEEQVLFDGFPLEEGQLNKAKLIEIGAKIGMALNPTLRVMFVWDASLLDKNSLKSLISLCEKKGYQLFLEIVDFDGEGELDIKFAEEYVS